MIPVVLSADDPSDPDAAIADACKDDGDDNDDNAVSDADAPAA